MSEVKRIDISDMFGAAVSGLCAIHCTLTPLFFAAKPLLDSSMEGHAHGGSFWSALDYVFLVLSVIAVWYSSRHTTHAKIKWILWISWLFFATGLVLEQFDFGPAKWLMYIGSFALIITHLQNYRYCQKCKDGTCL